ncbi:MAG TPA: hypothetical protein VFC36_04725, partial [Paludibacter sp.]|nr:hypothetical protein [Paludibacter sp.]
MANKLINCILDALHLKENRLTLLRNSDRFFHRKEVQDELFKLGVNVVVGCTLDLRIDFELNFKTGKVQNSCYLIDCKEDLLEDMLNDGCYYDFQLITYFPEYSPEIFLNSSIYELNLLYCNKPMQTLSEKQTVAYLSQCITTEISDKNYIKKNIFSGLKSFTNLLEINWDNAILPISMLIQTAIKEDLWADIIPDIKNLNERFQKHLEDNYRSHIVPSSFVKRPRIVSNILPYFDFNFTS